MEIKKIDSSVASMFLRQNFSAPTHWPDWNLIIAKFFLTDFFYLGAYENKLLVGVCPFHAQYSKNKLFTKLFSGHFYFLPNGGWIFNKEIILKKRDLPRHFFTKSTIYFLPEYPEVNATVKGKIFDYKRTLVVDLKLALEEIWMGSINSKRRNMIRKAESQFIQVRSIDTNEIGVFYDLYFDASKRNGLYVLPINFFKELFGCVNIEILILGAFKEDEQLANIVVMSDKNVGIYWMGNNSTSASLGQGELLQWEAIKYLKNKGCTYYDLCFIDPEKLPNIYSFKKGISSRELKVPIYRSRSLIFKISSKVFSSE